MRIVTAMRWIMLVSGLLTTTMVYAALDPQAAMQSTFGETIDGAAADIVVRSWGALIALVGLMLIYGAFDTAARPLVLGVAGASKLVFIGLVLSHGTRFLGPAALPVAVDSVMVLLFAWYLVASWRTPARPAATSMTAPV